MSAYFISLEGGEGSGKTTQVTLLKSAFEKAGIAAVFTREPGGGPGAEAIRELLLTGAGDKWSSITETLLFQAARTEHVERVIRPALARGEVVVCDRFVDSTIVYQGKARGLGADYIRALHLLTLGDFKPDLTLYIDIAPETGLKRAGERKGTETRFESLDLQFHESVRAGFLALAKAEPQRVVKIDGAQSKETVHAAICAQIKQLGVAL